MRFRFQVTAPFGYTANNNDTVASLQAVQGINGGSLTPLPDGVLEIAEGTVNLSLGVTNQTPLARILGVFVEITPVGDASRDGLRLR